jgi:hypothetical protein
MVGRSLATGDLDGDGAPDLVVAGVGGPAHVFRNAAPRSGHWLALRLRDPAAGGRDAIGAEVTARGSGQDWWGVLQPATSYLVSHEPVIHFGLGPLDAIIAIEVIWPDGSRESHPGGPADRLLTLSKGSGKAAAP